MIARGLYTPITSVVTPVKNILVKVDKDPSLCNSNGF